MDQNENNNNLLDKLISIIKENKIKVNLVATILVASIILSLIFIQYQNKKNSTIAEKFIEAGVYLSSNDNDSARQIFEEIILSKNKFYSALSLSTILEKDLISSEEKILNYFSIVQSITKSQDQKDLLILKKGLYLIRIKKTKDGQKLLKRLIKEGSKFAFLAKEVIDK